MHGPASHSRARTFAHLECHKANPPDVSLKRPLLHRYPAVWSRDRLTYAGVYRSSLWSMRALVLALVPTMLLAVPGVRAVAAQGSPEGTASSARRATFKDTLAALTAGGQTTCVTTTVGDAYCWGSPWPMAKAFGRVRGPDGTPVQLRSVTASDFSRCALTIDGDVLCEPSVTGGYVDSAGAPVPVPAGCRHITCLTGLPMRGALPKVRLLDVTTGLGHACALAPNGAAHCWGNSSYGSLGNGSAAADSTAGKIVRAPARVVGSLRFSQISTQEYQTCGVTAPDQTIYCWGNGESDLPDDSVLAAFCNRTLRSGDAKPCVGVPIRVLPESLPGDHVATDDVKFVRVAVGLRMACAISTLAEAYCWGTNYRCELGRCRSDDSQRARRIAVPGRVAEVAPGYWHACARTEERRIFCWGNNVAGELGSLATANAGPDGGPPDYTARNPADPNAAYHDICFNGGRCSPNPVEVSSNHRWAALALGTQHACALADDDGGVYCWGGSDSTTLGANARFITCVNRSPMWKDVPCQPTPIRVPGLPPLSAPRSAALNAEAGRFRSVPPPNAQDPTRVIVSAEELRVVFPRDTTGLWGWSAREAAGRTTPYGWQVTVEGMDGPAIVSLFILPDSVAAREFTSLESLVATAKPSCAGVVSRNCGSDVKASVVEHRVVLTLRIPATIARLFGLRPATVSVLQRRPGEPYRFVGDTVRVEYVAPQIPEPNAVTQADAKRSRRAYEVSMNLVSRWIGNGDLSRGTQALWLVVGDSATVSVEEMHCRSDMCRQPLYDPIPTWSIDDSAVATLRTPGAGRTSARLSGSRAAVIVAKRAGRTIVRASLPPSASDTLPSRTPPSRALQRTVHVLVPVERVKLEQTTDTLRAQQQAEFRAHAFDKSGRRIVGAPVQVNIAPGTGAASADEDGRVFLYLSSAGTQTIVASLRGKADTVVVQVLPPAR